MGVRTNSFNFVTNSWLLVWLRHFVAPAEYSDILSPSCHLYTVLGEEVGVSVFVRVGVGRWVMSKEWSDMASVAL